MSYLENFKIELDKEVLVYSPGDCVSGRLYLTLGETIKINCISVKAKGYAYVY